MGLPIVSTTLLAFSWLGATSAFSFTTETPTQCDDIKITWEGGVPPFTVLLTPVFGTPRNLSIPDTSFNNGAGEYTIEQLPFPSSQKMMMTMSDSTGFGTGGNTDVLTVGSAVKGTQCNTTDIGVDFSYELNVALQQCRSYRFDGFTGAVQPVTIMGLIPNGDAFIIAPTLYSTSFTWIANVWNGTEIIWVLSDGAGRSGGSSDIKSVGMSDDQSCIDGSSPSVTATGTPSSTSTSSASATATSDASEQRGGITIGAIAGSVLGAVLLIATIMTLGLFCLKRRQQRGRNGDGHGGGDYRRRSGRLQSEVDLVAAHDDVPNYAAAPGSAYGIFPQRDERDPYIPNNRQSQNREYSNAFSSNPFGSSQDRMDASDGTVATVDPFMESQATTATMSSAQRKAAMAGVSAYTPSRFILHTDVEDVLPPPNDDGVVELPPQYSERRALAPSSFGDSERDMQYPPSASKR